jgi:hypothetical protein
VTDLRQPASFTDSGELVEILCPTCGSDDCDESEGVIEDTDGRCYLWRGFVCQDCGRCFR